MFSRLKVIDTSSKPCRRRGPLAGPATRVRAELLASAFAGGGILNPPHNLAKVTEDPPEGFSPRKRLRDKAKESVTDWMPGERSRRVWVNRVRSLRDRDARGWSGRIAAAAERPPTLWPVTS